MTPQSLEKDVKRLEITDEASPSSSINGGLTDEGGDGGVRLTCLSSVVDEVTLHFQIIRLPKQIFAWIGCNSAKIGTLYAAPPTRPSNTVRLTSLVGGSSGNTGSAIVRRLVLKCGLPVVLSCNIPKNSPMLEANAEKTLMQKLIGPGYARSKGASSLN